MKTNDKNPPQIAYNSILDSLKHPATEGTSMKVGLLFISSFPPRACGIATYTTDLINAIEAKFQDSFEVAIVTLETEGEQHRYERIPWFVLDTSDTGSYIELANQINQSEDIHIVAIQHEFGLFKEQEDMFGIFLGLLKKEIVITFHTVLPNPTEKLRQQVVEMADNCKEIIVMTKHSAHILIEDYAIASDKITVIQHGTHLLPAKEKAELKSKYALNGRKILSTFGLLGRGKNIETTLHALPKIIAKHPDVLFLIIGKTHPSIVAKKGELYREELSEIIARLDISQQVRFVNAYLPTEDLLEYLLLTDVYLFTSNDRNQAVSGTFSYAISSGCPIVSTPIPHVMEVLKDDMGIIIDFEAPDQLADAAIKLLGDSEILQRLALNNLQKTRSTSWQNSAIAHANVFQPVAQSLKYNLPEIRLDHIERMTTDFGMIQFAKIATPDLTSGYTLDDNARALVAVCLHYELFRDSAAISLMDIYIDFIENCLQEDGRFLNYVGSDKLFTSQNEEVNLDDANGRAAWALGQVISLQEILPREYIQKATYILEKALPALQEMTSTRAMSFTIKGLHLQNKAKNQNIIEKLANQLVAMYKTEADDDWHWFEPYLTYGNSAVPEALLCAHLSTGIPLYGKIAQVAFDFLLSKIYIDERIRVISNKGWEQKGVEQHKELGGEQPIDITYTILALDKFEELAQSGIYDEKMKQAFEWFLGKNHLNQIVYNPVTGGCYDGVEEKYINLNQGAESTVSYLIARLVLAKREETLAN